MIREQPTRLPRNPVRSAMQTISRLLLAMLAEDVPVVLTWGHRPTLAVGSR